MSTRSYVGIDGCRKGWCYTILTNDSGPGIDIVSHVEQIWLRCKAATPILIDIPIGLPALSSSRACDTQARRLLAPHRASSVFPPPCREALYAENYKEACEINRKILGKKISRQTWNIMPKIREIDEFLRSHPDARKKIRETHPEVCFRALAGKPIIHSKKSNEGFFDRLAVLTRYLPEAENAIIHTLSRTKRADVTRDDVLDSMAAAITAAFGNKRLGALPKNPEIDRAGLPMEIVYPEVRFFME